MVSGRTEIFSVLDIKPSRRYLLIMNESYKKKKQPEVVRAHLMDAAAKAAVERGLGSLTLDLVAQKAGVSKGGLLHHYPSRRALIEGLFHTLMSESQSRMEKFIQEDADTHGRFTRAYIKVFLSQNSSFENRLHGAFALAMSNDIKLAELWFGWLREQLEKHGEDTSSVTGRMIRYAVDGIWLEDCTGGTLMSPTERRNVVGQLINLTFTL